MYKPLGSPFGADGHSDTSGRKTPECMLDTYFFRQTNPYKTKKLVNSAGMPDLPFTPKD